MSLKWSSSASETGILRKNEPFERKEELLVFGYSCKIFRDNEKALHIDQGKHLIPWMGDETLKIDRYDARGALHELSALEAPPGGHDWHLELTDAEKRVEVLCDEERYRALYCDENEEEMYKEEELKRLHAVGMGRGYGQVGFKYDEDQSDKTAAQDENLKKAEEKTEDDEPFVLDNELNVPPGIAVPETKKLNAIIEKTALFISSHGTQMEILLKAKQAGNSQFDFLSMDCPLHAYYRYMVEAIKHHSYAPNLTKTSEPIEVKHEEADTYLHPSLAAPPLQAAPSIPSIHYKPSADCDYTMLITKIRGTEPQDDFDDDDKPADVPRGELAPPGTVPLTLPHETMARNADPHLYVKSEISKGPVMYRHGEAANKVKVEEADERKEVQATHVGYDSHGSNTNSPNADMMAKKSVGLNLMHYYNSDSASDSDSSDTETSVKSQPQAPSQAVVIPPAELQLIIDKMAAYVARNGDSFESIVRARNDPRFSFLESDNKFNAYYKKTMADMCKENSKSTKMEEVKKEKIEEKVRNADSEKKSRTIAPVSFSIKKLKEPEPVLPKPALPYESSSEEEDAENSETKTQTPKPQPANNHATVHAYVPQTLIPPSVIYKIDTFNTNLNDEVKKKVNEKENYSKSRRHRYESNKDISYDSNKDSHDRKDGQKNKNMENVDPPLNSSKPAGGQRQTENVDKEKSKERLESNTIENEKYALKHTEVQNIKGKDKKEKNRHIEVRRSSVESSKNRSADITTKEIDEGVDVDISKGVVDDDSSKGKEEREEGELEDGEIIMVDCDTGVESPTEFIDLTGDVSDDKTSATHKDSSQSKRKQMERKRRAAAFLAAVQRGDSTTASSQPVPSDVAAIIQPNTLASVMVKTLCDIQAKKDAEEEQKERRKHKHKRKHHRSKNQSEESSKEETEESSRKERHKRKRKLKHADRSPSEYSHRHREELEQHEKRKKKKDSNKESSRSKKSKRSRSSSKSKKERKRSPSKIVVNNDTDELKSEGLQAEDAERNEKRERKDDKSVRKTSRRREKATYSEGEWEQDSGGDSDVKRESGSSAGDVE